MLLAVGRHFRLSDRVKVVVGREMLENKYIEREWSDQWLAVPVDVPGPTTLILGQPTEEELETAAAFTARYSDAKREESVEILLAKGKTRRRLDARPASDSELEARRI